MMPHDLPPWKVVFYQTQRWIRAGCFEAMVDDLRGIIRLADGREEFPTAMIADSRTLQSSVESGPRAGFDGHKKRKGSKVHMAVDTMGNLLAAHVSPANEQERKHLQPLTEKVLKVTEGNVKTAFTDQGYTGEETKMAVAEQGVEVVVVKYPEAKKGSVLLPRRWVVERSFAWMARFRRLSRDYERISKTLIGLHYVAFSMLLMARLVL